MKKNTIALMFLMFLILVPATLRAQESLQLKSEQTAWILGLDPLSMDGLFYGGKPIQATINGLIGIPGGLAFWAGVAMMNATCTGGPGSDCDDLDIVGGMFLVGGALLYIPALIWDCAGGVSGVIDHNRLVKERLTENKRKWNLSISPTKEGAFLTARLEF